jgi:GNAT superfamily N-acetyltransferase
MIADAAGGCAARCSLWWTRTPIHAGHRLGFIGNYAAREAAAAVGLFQSACKQLAGQGCSMAVGPLDGNTWRRYRLLTERGTEPIFFLEPDNPDDWPMHFTSNGFTPLAQYYSALNSDLDVEDSRMPAQAERIASLDIQLRTFNLARFEEELRAIHGLSLASFTDNILYTPITEEDFVAQYRGVQPYVQPELVILAEQGGRPVGFIFAIPDLLQAKRGQAIDTVILKTMAVHPEFRSVGLGGLLMARCQQTARRLGFRRAIHALMHEGNHSKRISSHTAKIMRRYTLYGKELGPAS